MEKSFEELLKEEELNSLAKGKIVSGEVVRKSNDGIWVDLKDTIGDVFVNHEELTKKPNTFEIGEEITVKVINTNDAEGFNTASETKAIREKMLKELNIDDIKNVKFDIRLKRGYGVLIENEIRAFLPGSLSMLKPNSPMPDKMQKMKIISKEGRKIVVSRRDVVEDAIEKVFSEYREQMVVEGEIESVKKFGAFLKLNDHVTALIPVSEVSWERDINIFSLLKSGNKVKGIIINIDKDKNKISVSLKQLQRDPWSNIHEKYSTGDIVQGKVKKIFPFGFAVKLETGVEGLVHESEIFWGRKGKIDDIAKIDENIEVKILEIDETNKKMSLSYKQAIGNPWENIEEKYKIDEIYEGTVEKILPNGAIVKLEEGLTGFLHVSEVSWNFIDDINDSIKEGDKVNFKILSIDSNTNKIKLSLKQAIENPWKKLIEEVKVGDEITGKVFRFTEKGAVILVDNYEVEAFLPVSKASLDRIESVKDILKENDEIKAKVIDIEFENEDKRGNMIISISDIIKEEEKKEMIESMNKLNEEEEV